MNKFTVTTLISFLALVVAIELPLILEALVSFLLVGAIPGTTLSISPNMMLFGAIGTSFLLVILLFADYFPAINPGQRTAKRVAKRFKKELPKRRYRHI